MKRFLIFATAVVAFASCAETASNAGREYFFDEEELRVYNDPNAEFDTLSYSAGMNMGLVLSLQNAEFELDTEAVIALLDKEFKSAVTDQDKFDEANEYMANYSSEIVRPYMMAKRTQSRVVTDCPDTLMLPELYNETYTREAFTKHLTVIFADNIRKQRLPVNIYWAYEAMRDATDVKTKEDIDSVMALSERDFMTVISNYSQRELPEYNMGLTSKWFERVASEKGVEVMTNADGTTAGVYYRINKAGGETKPFNDTDSIGIKYEVYSRTGKLLESNEMFIETLKKQREQVANNPMFDDAMRQTYYDQIDAELANSAVRRLPLKQFLMKDVQQALKNIGEGGDITIWLAADKAFGFRASRILPINEGVVVNVELVELKTVKPTPIPMNNVIVMPAGDVKAKMAPKQSLAPKVAPSKNTVTPVQK